MAVRYWSGLTLALLGVLAAPAVAAADDLFSGLGDPAPALPYRAATFPPQQDGLFGRPVPPAAPRRVCGIPSGPADARPVRRRLYRIADDRRGRCAHPRGAGLCGPAAALQSEPRSAAAGVAAGLRTAAGGLLRQSGPAQAQASYDPAAQRPRPGAPADRPALSAPGGRLRRLASGRAPSSSTRRKSSCFWCSRAAGRCATASASAGRASPGRA